MSRRSGRAKQSATESSRTPEIDNAPELDEQAEVTRCICGNDEIASINTSLQRLLLLEYSIKIDNGLFIQCDKCLVWQHGYCVGLFIDNDVPDKYWCEQCKPSLHMLVTDNEDRTSRTLYRPVNDGRDALLKFLTEKESGAAKPADSDSTLSHTLSNRQTRKERRHVEDSFDEQLQRALRESAASTERKRNAQTDSAQSNKRSHSEDLENDVNDSNLDDDTDLKTAKRDSRVKSKLRAKQKARSQSSRGLASQPKSEADSLVVTKEELLSQPLQPRFVNEKSTIYELRKRTGAILEWLGRSQMELEEERDVKTLQFKEANVEGANLLLLVEENSKLMENLTEKILAWEQRFGKYAP
ncbi:hypothetical protein METBIDRAFT_34545 [Metschnikowia bicuspidata var. bicuspidata NRRL YB-4993]|uniref:Zinc finger PHD-type domain-containing protein n=1 Tax=Metschnikowia bicuspidata var. bicuspidata NRRL YB-4993 TaxID=869754 RepID=A0A1A0HG64_9ASCO|nr:hypothetical protein METBIDRAFT_34545 [Metschnikowia bicuspidata var. bicuspidata NRRL YB-4993]OBA22980.1 hypothetical protein METBIDRAFT_34545 [Metschnikowia bicuspidata var. bicuspidata NRRL YB-4993]